MPKKTETPAVAQPTTWTAEDKAAHFAEVDQKLAVAMKSFPTAGSAKDLAEWLNKNSSIGYKNLMRRVFAAYGLR